MLMKLNAVDLTAVTTASSDLGFCSLHSHYESFFSSLISFLKPCPLAAIAKTCCKFSHVGASFPTCTSPTR